MQKEGSSDCSYLQSPGTGTDNHSSCSDTVTERGELRLQLPPVAWSRHRQPLLLLRHRVAERGELRLQVAWSRHRQPLLLFRHRVAKEGSSDCSYLQSPGAGTDNRSSCSDTESQKEGSSAVIQNIKCTAISTLLHVVLYFCTKQFILLICSVCVV